MKTIVKFTALAVLALAALSCAPEPTLTSRDWGEYNSQNDAKLTGNPNDSSVLPSISTTTSLAFAANLTEEDRELVLVFPADADFLKSENDKLEGKLKEFLTINLFTNPAPTAPETVFYSTVGANVDYAFVRRNNGLDNSKAVANITIRLSASLPTDQTTPDPSGLIIKIDGARYKVNGKGLDLDNDGNAGEAIYDEGYVTIMVEEAPTFVGPRRSGSDQLTLTIGDASDTTSTTASKIFTIAELTGIGIGGASLPVGDPQNVRRKDILESLISKFKVQKFNPANGSWTDIGAQISYENSDSSPNYGKLITTVTVEDWGIYRVYAEGLKGLKTTGLEAVYGADQKISIANTVDTKALGLRGEKWASALQGYSLVDARTDATLNTVTLLKYDHNNASKKVTAEFSFPAISFGTPTASDRFLKKDPDLFKKYVRFAYLVGGDEEETWTSETKLSHPVDDDTTIFVEDATVVTTDDTIRINGKRFTVSSADDTSTPQTITVDKPVTANKGAEVYKLGAVTSKLANTSDLVNLSDIAFIKINEVKFEEIYDPGTTTPQVATKVIITADSGYKGDKTLYLLIAPGLEYDSEHIIFGDYTAIDTVIDGIRGWKFYDSIGP